MKSPLVSVCIPTYNYARFLRQAVESVLTQTFSDYELIVIDDCSNDETEQVMQQLCIKDSRIKYLRNPENVGMVENWNRCLSCAEGKYIKFLFADDFLVSDKAIERMVETLLNNEHVALVSTSRLIVSDASEVLTCTEYVGKDCCLKGFPVIQKCLLDQINYIGEPSAVMFRKDQAVRGFDITYRQVVDLEMWFHLLEQGWLAYISEPLCAFRIHGEQQTAVNARENVSEAENIRLASCYMFKDYIDLRMICKKFFLYDKCYKMWKLYRRFGETDRKKAYGIISTYGTPYFFYYLPLYKIIKPFTKIKKIVSRL